MEPISIIVAALSLGIASGLKETAPQAIKDAYSGLKQLVERRYSINLSNLEQKPDSEARKAVVAETLEEKNAQDDAELIEQANAVVEAVEQHAPDVAPSVGVDLENVKVGIARIRTINAGPGATGFRAKDSEFDELNIDDINAGTDPKN